MPGFFRGTIEQLIMTPVTSLELIIGKLMPYILIGAYDFIIILILSYILFGVAVFLQILRGIIVKGAGLEYLAGVTAVLMLQIAVIILVTMKKFKKTLD